MKKIEEKIIRFIEEYKLINHGEKILVALSGGPDSVFLLQFLSKFKRKYRITIGAMHINHLIRGKTAEKDEKFCRSLCINLGIKYHSTVRNVPEYSRNHKMSLEEAAREIRYQELSKVCNKFGYSKIATGHNCNDNAETLLLNLLKGTGIKGLSGIPIKRENIIRPILAVTKSEIIQYLQTNKIAYVLDETNLSSEYQRNFIRNKLFPLIKEKLNPKVESTLFKTSIILKQQFLALNSTIKILSESVSTHNKNKLEIKIDKLKTIDENLWSEVLKYTVDSKLKVKLTFEDCFKILSLISKPKGKRIGCSNSITAVKEENEIVIVKGWSANPIHETNIRIGEQKIIDKKKISLQLVKKDSIKMKNDSRLEYIDAQKVSKNFQIRIWKPGDKFYPLGMTGTQNVSDFLTNRKISTVKKNKQLVLLNKNRIVWVIGQRIDNRFKLTDNTRKVLQLCLN
ncbi:MAG: tRNA lysidine(34) synthetase TilS [Ignavibacteriaceae bacterium]|nr:tRNA lysidine(34) synthetase TilS [Ignavibacteriaceae bacterium]